MKLPYTHKPHGLARLVCLCLASIALSASAECPQCRALAEKLAADPRLPTGMKVTVGKHLAAGWLGLRSPEAWEYTLQRPPCAAEARVEIEHPLHRVLSLRVPYDPTELTQQVLPYEQLQGVALEFARDHFPCVWQRGFSVVPYPRDTHIWPEGVVRFRWVAHSGEVGLPLAVSVEVSVCDARVVAADLTDIPPTIPITPKLSREQAISVARVAARALVPKATELPLYYAHCGIWVDPQAQGMTWAITFAHPNPDELGNPRGIDVSVNALDGSVSKTEVMWLSPEDLWRMTDGQQGRPPLTGLEHPGGFEEASPAWTPDGKQVVFQSTRGRPGRPGWCQREPGVFIVEVDGRSLRVIEPGVDGPSTYPAVSPDGEELVCLRRDGRLLWLHLTTGRWRILNREDRPAGAATWAPDGSSVVFHALRRQGDTDIFQCGLRREGGMVIPDDRFRLVHLTDIDIFPIFAPDGSRVYWGHCSLLTGPLEAYEGGALYRVLPGRQYWENPPELILGKLGGVKRLSFFPDGRRLLVSHGDKLDVVDVEAKTRTPLGLPALHDPELPADCPALRLRDPAVSPDGTRLAFSGYIDSGDPEHGTGWFIYTCRLDGSELKRITPLEDAPVEPYVFPETGKTALDVARETALIPQVKDE